MECAYGAHYPEPQACVSTSPSAEWASSRIFTLQTRSLYRRAAGRLYAGAAWRSGGCCRKVQFWYGKGGKKDDILLSHWTQVFHCSPEGNLHLEEIWDGAFILCWFWHPMWMKGRSFLRTSVPLENFCSILVLVLRLHTCRYYTAPLSPLHCQLGYRIV